MGSCQEPLSAADAMAARTSNTSTATYGDGSRSCSFALSFQHVSKSTELGVGGSPDAISFARARSPDSTKIMRKVDAEL